MRSKGFESLSIEPSGEVKVVVNEEEPAAKTESAEKEGSLSEKPGAKVDRRQKLQPKAKVEPGPGDVELTKEHIEAAREELWVEGKDGNKNPTEEELISRARMGVFSTMSDKEVAERAISAIMADEPSAKEIVEKTNKALRESAASSEENARKWEEVDREQEIEQERKREEIERVEALQRELGGRDDAAAFIENSRKYHIERIEQSRKREEAARVEAIEQERKREEVARVKALEAQKVQSSKPRSFVDIVFGKKKPVEPARAKEISQEEKAESIAVGSSSTAENGSESTKHRSFVDIVFKKK